MTHIFSFLKMLAGAFVIFAVMILYSGYDVKEHRSDVMAEAYKYAERGVPAAPEKMFFLSPVFGAFDKMSLDAFYGAQADGYITYDIMVKSFQEKAGLGSSCSSVRYHGSDDIVEGIKNSPDALTCCMPPPTIASNPTIPIIFNKDKSRTYFVCGDASLTHVVSMPTSDVNQALARGHGYEYLDDFDISDLSE